MLSLRCDCLDDVDTRCRYGELLGLYEIAFHLALIYELAGGVEHHQCCRAGLSAVKDRIENVGLAVLRMDRELRSEERRVGKECRL